MRTIRRFITSVFILTFALLYLVFVVYTGALFYERVFTALEHERLWAYLSSVLPTIAFVVGVLFALNAGWAAAKIFVRSLHSLKAYTKAHQFQDKNWTAEERHREEHATLWVGFFNVLLFTFSSVLLYFFFRGMAYYFDLTDFSPGQVFVASFIFTIAFFIISVMAWSAMLALTANLSEDDLEEVVEEIEEPV